MATIGDAVTSPVRLDVQINNIRYLRNIFDVSDIFLLFVMNKNNEVWSVAVLVSLLRQNYIY